MDFLNIFWVFIVALSIAAEAVTTQLVSIWFMVGGLFALIFSLFGLSFFIQVSVFVLVSVIMLILIRPFIKNILKFKIQKTNFDRLIGEIALVTEKIDNLEEKGTVNIAGMDWSARSLTGENIQSGERVQIDSISGVKLIVHKI